MKRTEPIRVLHVLGGMHRGGVETWLVHVLRHMDPARIRMDFLVHCPGPFPFDEELRTFGARTLYCPEPQRPWRYAATFRHLLREHGPYDVVHSHVHHYSGFVMRLARQVGVPVRIAHSHLDYTGDQENLLRRLYFRLMKHWIEQNATVGIAASRLAAAALFGSYWDQTEARQLLYYGIDLSPFHSPAPASCTKAALGMDPDAFVIGHVGRMVEQKNHKFLIEIFVEVARRDPRAWLLLVGAGELRPEVERQVDQAGLRRRVVFAGVRPDVPRLMLGAMDLFLLPSLYEGLPLVGLEAQGAGLPMVVSDAVTPELDFIPELVNRLSLAVPAQSWAEKILAVRNAPRPVSRPEALARMTDSPFNIEAGIQALAGLYEQQVNGNLANAQPEQMLTKCGAPSHV